MIFNYNATEKARKEAGKIIEFQYWLPNKINCIKLKKIKRQLISGVLKNSSILMF